MPRPTEPPDFAASQLFLRRLAYHLVRDAARAEDLVQDTWTAWVERRPRAVAEPKAWLARVLRNRAFNLKRDDERRARREGLAGRPDASTPETDGTLEAQAQLVAALRALEEPYRSTLVQRYYHDLGPKEIAERTGAPLDTVKARLARGLERLRAALDRRYHGDRGAWCHWLISLAHPPIAPIPPAGPAPPPPAALARTDLSELVAAGAAGHGASAGLGPWLLLAGALVAGVGWVLTRPERAPSGPLSPVTFGAEPRPAAVDLAPPRRAAERARTEPESAPRTAEPVPAAAPPAAPVAFAPALPFEWPQLAGMPTHDDFSAFRARIDLIQRPRVLWHQRGLAGQPTIAGTELYSGGQALYRLDLVTNRLSSGSREVEERIRGVRGHLRGRSSDWDTRLFLHGLTSESWVAGAPVLTRDLVIARMVGDGSVSAFDRDLTLERWRWEPTRPAPSPLSGCLVGERYLAAHGTEVVALSAVNGTVDWRFDTGDAGEVDVVPASDGDLVYFATVTGVVFALDLARGEEEWRTESDSSDPWSHPVVLGDRVVLSWRSGALSAFQSYDGRELWSRSMEALSRPAIGAAGVLLADAHGAAAYSAESGSHVTRVNVERSRSDKTRHLTAAPVAVGERLFVSETGALGSRVLAMDLQRSLTWWTCELGAALAPLALVHAGDRLYVATTGGLLCLDDEPGAEPAPAGFVFGPEAERRVQEREQEPLRERAQKSRKR